MLQVCKGKMTFYLFFFVIDCVGMEKYCPNSHSDLKNQFWMHPERPPNWEPDFLSSSCGSVNKRFGLGPVSKPCSVSLTMLLWDVTVIILVDTRTGSPKRNQNLEPSLHSGGQAALWCGSGREGCETAPFLKSGDLGPLCFLDQEPLVWSWPSGFTSMCFSFLIFKKNSNGNNNNNNNKTYLWVLGRLN